MAVAGLGFLLLLCMPFAYATAEQVSAQVLFQGALADQAAGRHQQAREGFDALQETELREISAVPSAVNLVSLGRYREAQTAFAALASGANPRDAEYATLWQLWLAARDSQASPAVQQHVTTSRLQQPHYRAIRDLYNGSGTPGAVFAAVDALPVDDALRRDARAEAGFFIGGYYQFVRNDSKAALRIYQRGALLSEASLEGPLLRDAIESLIRPTPLNP